MQSKTWLLFSTYLTNTATDAIINDAVFVTGVTLAAVTVAAACCCCLLLLFIVL